MSDNINLTKAVFKDATVPFKDLKYGDMFVIDGPELGPEIWVKIPRTETYECGNGHFKHKPVGVAICVNHAEYYLNCNLDTGCRLVDIAAMFGGYERNDAE